MSKLCAKRRKLCAFQGCGGDVAMSTVHQPVAVVPCRAPASLPRCPSPPVHVLERMRFCLQGWGYVGATPRSVCPDPLESLHCAASRVVSVSSASRCVRRAVTIVDCLAESSSVSQRRHAVGHDATLPFAMAGPSWRPGVRRGRRGPSAPPAPGTRARYLPPKVMRWMTSWPSIQRCLKAAAAWPAATASMV